MSAPASGPHCATIGGYVHISLALRPAEIVEDSRILSVASKVLSSALSSMQYRSFPVRSWETLRALLIASQVLPSALNNLMLTIFNEIRKETRVHSIAIKVLPPAFVDVTMIAPAETVSVSPLYLIACKVLPLAFAHVINNYCYIDCRPHSSFFVP